MKLDNLKAAALAATPGKWSTHNVHVWDGETSIADCGMGNGKSRENAVYIAACDPQTIMKLIAVVMAAQKHSDTLEGRAHIALIDALEALNE